MWGNSSVPVQLAASQGLNSMELVMIIQFSDSFLYTVCTYTSPGYVKSVTFDG
jgi:hypothetical protein